MRRFLSLPCPNRNTTTNHNTRCVTTNHHISFLNSSSSNLLMEARCRHRDTHLKDHLKDLHPLDTSHTPHPTCPSSKTRSVTSLLGHPQSNHPSSPDLASAASILPQHHPTGLHHFTSSPEASRTNRKHHSNPSSAASQHHSKQPQTNTLAPAHLHPPVASKARSALTASTH
jgi:hypothetical protein